MAKSFSGAQSVKNIISNVTAFLIQFIISLYVAPLIVSKVGASAFGFLGLANDFVGYAGILATVFNSVAARFIAAAYYKEDFEKANSYFNSLIVTNIVIAAGIGILAMVLVPSMDKLLVVPEAILFDVKLTFALVFTSYIVTLVTTVFTTSTFVANRTDIQGVRNIVQYLIRFACIVVFLNFISVKIYWVALSSLIAASVIAVMNVRLTKVLTPELTLNPRYAKRSYTLELAKSGVWMALTSISVILLRGLDLTVANIMVGHYEMGLLSIARQMPNNVTSVIGTIAPIFTPVFLARYVEKDISGLLDKVKETIRWMTMIIYAPVTVFIVYSYDFYGLWQKSLSEQELIIVTTLSIATVVQAYFNSVTVTMAQLSVVVNKLKLPVIITFICGVVSLVVELLLLTYTDFGLYAIVLPTTIVMIIRYVVFNSIYAAYCIEQPRAAFFGSVVKSIICIPLLLAVTVLVWKIAPVDSWPTLALSGGLALCLGWCITIALYGRREVKMLISRLRQ